MDAAAARARFDETSIARLATASGDGRPHVVPITFARLGENVLVTAVDHKPKRTTALRRLANIAANPAVTVLVDHYCDDWSQLWWARADGKARVVSPDTDPAAHGDAVAALAARYPQYRERPPAGPAIVMTVQRWTGWAARPVGPAGRPSSPEPPRSAAQPQDRPT